MKNFLKENLIFLWLPVFVCVTLLSIGCFVDEDDFVLDDELVQNSTGSALHRIYFRNS